jgi:phage regulator Rha-like protein
MKKSLVLIENIENLIVVMRNKRVVWGTDLAKIYGVVNWRLTEQVKRNRDRFPEDFFFQLTEEEEISLTSQIARSNKGRGGRRTKQYAFTEHGAIMAANVLRSERAIQMSVFVVRAFVKMRETLAENKSLAAKLEELEKKITTRMDEHEDALAFVLQELKKLREPVSLPVPKKRPIGFGKELDFQQ